MPLPSGAPNAYTGAGLPDPPHSRRSHLGLNGDQTRRNPSFVAKLKTFALVGSSHRSTSRRLSLSGGIGFARDCPVARFILPDVALSAVARREVGLARAKSASSGRRGRTERQKECATEGHNQ